MKEQEQSLKLFIEYITNILENKFVDIYLCNINLISKTDHGKNIFFVKKVNNNDELINYLFYIEEIINCYVNDTKSILYRLNPSLNNFNFNISEYKDELISQYYFKAEFLNDHMIKIDILERIDANIKKLHKTIINFLISYLKDEEKIVDYDDNLLMITKSLTTYPCSIKFTVDNDIINKYPFLLEGINYKNIPIFIEPSIYDMTNQLQLTLLLNRQLLYSAVYSLV